MALVGARFRHSTQQKGVWRWLVHVLDKHTAERCVALVGARFRHSTQQKGVWRWLVHVLDIAHSRKVCGIGWCTF